MMNHRIFSPSLSLALLSAFSLSACGGEDNPLGQEDGGLPVDGRTDERSDGPANQPVSGDGSLTRIDAGQVESEVRNLVVTLLERTTFAGGATEDLYRGTFTIQNGSEPRGMREISRLVIETPAGRVSFTDWSTCGGVYGLSLYAEATEVFRFDLTYKSGSMDALLETSCGQSVRTSAPPTIPTVMTVEVHGLYDDGTPFTLTTSAMTIDGR